MLVSTRFSIVLVIATLLLTTGLPSGLVAGEAYHANNRPLKCFMKDFCEVDDSFNALSQKIKNFHLTDDEPKNAEEVRGLGKVFYEKYQGKFDTLLKATDKILAEPLPSFTEEQVEAIRSTTNIIDYRFCRTMAYLFKAVAYHLYKSDKPREATDLLRLCFRFGQIIEAGDGEPPLLLQAMVGISLRNLALEDLPAMIMRSNALPADYLEKVSASFAKMETEGVSFTIPFKLSLAFNINCIQHEFDAMLDPKIAANRPLIRQVESIKNPDMKRIQGECLRRLTEVQNQATDMLQRNFGNPRRFREEFSSFSRELSRKAEASSATTSSGSIDPNEKVADTLASISFPNIGKAFEQWQKGRYKVLGMAAMFKVAASVKNGGVLPKTADALKKVLGTDLPIDLFSDKKDPCVFKNDNGKILLYSVGGNGLDEGGNADHDNDIILFRY